MSQRFQIIMELQIDKNNGATAIKAIVHVTKISLFELSNY